MVTIMQALAKDIPWRSKEPRVLEILQAVRTKLQKLAWLERNFFLFHSISCLIDQTLQRTPIFYVFKFTTHFPPNLSPLICSSLHILSKNILLLGNKIYIAPWADRQQHRRASGFL